METYPSLSASPGGAMFAPSSPSVSQFDPAVPKVVAVCRELCARETRPGERSPILVRQVIRLLLLDPAVDLLSVYAPAFDPAPPDHAYSMCYQLLNGRSVFFETLMEADDSLYHEAWQAIIAHCDRSLQLASDATSSVLMRCISEMVSRLLPVSTEDAGNGNGTGEAVRRPTKPLTVRTPLELFLPDSPFLSRVPIADESRLSSSSLHPRHVTMLCQLVLAACNSHQFPSPHRLVLVRYLLKQFHIFCLHQCNDAESMCVKKALHTRPPFAAALYHFLHSALDVSPSVNTFKDVASVWLCYARPWRYAEAAVPMEATEYMPFIHTHDKFYTVLLGKILRRLRELDIGVESVKVVRTVLECTWRQPFADALQRLGVDPSVPVAQLLDRLAETARVQRRMLSSQGEKTESLWDRVFGAGEDEATRRGREMAEAIEQLVAEAEAELGITTSGPTPSQDDMHTPVRHRPRQRAESVGAEPDHEKDRVTGLAYLTPRGRRQVLSGERSFDFSPCGRVLPMAGRHGWTGEVAALASVAGTVSQWLARTEPFRLLAYHYDQDGLLGGFARTVLDPPCPNPRMKGTVPVFSDRLPRVPAAPRLRWMARYWVLAVLCLLLLSCIVHPLLILAALVLFAIVALVAAADC